MRISSRATSFALQTKAAAAACSDDHVGNGGPQLVDASVRLPG
jgi:hypothetical protein